MMQVRQIQAAATEAAPQWKLTGEHAWAGGDLKCWARDVSARDQLQAGHLVAHLAL